MPVTYVTVSRILFVVFFLSHLYFFSRQSPEERKNIDGTPRFLPLTVVLMSLPMFLALPLPDWLALMVTVVLAVSLAVLLGGRIQLVLANSYSMAPGTPTEIQQDGMFRWLEHPIYTGITVFMVAWSFWNPLALIAAYFQYEALRVSVRHEREFLKAMGTVHRGLDSALW